MDCSDADELFFIPCFPTDAAFSSPPFAPTFPAPASAPLKPKPNPAAESHAGLGLGGADCGRSFPSFFLPLRWRFFLSCDERTPTMPEPEDDDFDEEEVFDDPEVDVFDDPEDDDEVEDDEDFPEDFPDEDAPKPTWSSLCREGLGGADCGLWVFRASLRCRRNSVVRLIVLLAIDDSLVGGSELLLFDSGPTGGSANLPRISSLLLILEDECDAIDDDCGLRTNMRFICELRRSRSE